jgi:hypothetical protein
MLLSSALMRFPTLSPAALAAPAIAKEQAIARLILLKKLCLKNLFIFHDIVIDIPSIKGAGARSATKLTLFSRGGKYRLAFLRSGMHFMPYFPPLARNAPAIFPCFGPLAVHAFPALCFALPHTSWYDSRFNFRLRMFSAYHYSCIKSIAVNT